jgi:hypothetical protein
MSEEISSAPPRPDVDPHENTEEPLVSEALLDPSAPETAPTESPAEVSPIADESNNESSDNLKSAEQEYQRNLQTLNEVGGTILSSEILPLMKQLRSKTPEEMKIFLESNPEKRKLYEVAINLTYQGEQTFNLKGNPLSLGEGVSITKIKGVSEDDLLICEVLKDGQLVTQNFPRKDIMFRQIVSEREAITKSLPPEAQKLFSIYVDSLVAGGKTIDFGDDFNTVVAEAQEIYFAKAQQMAENNPEMSQVLELFKNPLMNITEILNIAESDPEERARLKELIESGNMQLGAFLLLMLVVGTFSAVTSMSQ